MLQLTLINLIDCLTKGLNRNMVLESSRRWGLAYKELSSHRNPTFMIGDPLKKVQCNNDKLID